MMNYVKNIENHRKLYRSHLCIKYHNKRHSPFPKCLQLSFKKKYFYRYSKYLLPYGFLFLLLSLEIISPFWLRCVSFMFYAVTVAMFLLPPHHVSVSLYKYRSCILIEYSNTRTSECIHLFYCETMGLFPFFFSLAPIFLQWVLLEQTFCARESLSREHTVE